MVEDKGGCWKRFDNWIWANNSNFTREEKAGNHVKGNRFVNRTLLFCLRIVFLGIMTFLWFQQLHHDVFHNKQFMKLQFLTNIALTMTVLNFLLLVIAHTMEKCSANQEVKDSASILHLWKWCS